MLYHLVRILLGVIFLAASWNKILNPEAFAQIVANYKVLPPQLVNPTAYLLPYIEAVCGLSLITGFWSKGGALIVTVLMVVFVSLFIINKFRGFDTNCGCFSLQTQPGHSISYYLVRDFGILTAGLWVFFYKFKSDRTRIINEM